MNGPNPEPPADGKLAVGSLTYTKLGLAMTCFWLLLGALAWNLKDRAGQPIAQLLLSDYGATNSYSANLIGAVPALIAMLFFPLVGYLSDRFRSPWGRRIPFLATTIPFIVISMAGLAASPWLGDQLDPAVDPDSSGNVSAAISSITIFWTLFAFADILGNSIFGALINDVIPQRVIGRFFGAFRAMALIAGIGYNYFLFNRAESSYVVVLLGIAACVVLALALLCLNVKEGAYPPAPPDPHGWTQIEHEARCYFRDCFGSPFYLLLFVAWALGSSAWNPINYYGASFSTAYVTATEYRDLLTLTFTISLVLAYPLGVLADRYHPLRLGIVALALYSVAALWGGLFATTTETFELAFVLHGVLSGVYMTSTASLFQRLLPRLKFAQFATMAGAVLCFWNILVVPFAGVLLESTNPDSHSIFLLSSVQGCLGLIATVFLFRAFIARGGDKNYIAPGDDFAAAKANR